MVLSALYFFYLSVKIIWNQPDVCDSRPNNLKTAQYVFINVWSCGGLCGLGWKVLFVKSILFVYLNNMHAMVAWVDGSQSYPSSEKDNSPDFAKKQ